MAFPSVRPSSSAEISRVIDAIVLAFAADPIARWAWPEPHQYLSNMPDMARAFGGGAFRSNSAHRTDDYAGAALWLPPGVAPDDEALGAIIGRSLDEAMARDVGAMFEAMAKYHPQEPHWYLPLIGVDPAHQGKGYGAALLAPALAECDRSSTLAYLESTNPRNVSLYRRHGFEVLGTIQVGSSPPMTPMLRRPR
jgi:ribosomal protein S18 acetylase RimI-like enzyme